MVLNNDQAAELFAQLGNATRLCIIRILVEAGDAGLRVGEIQNELGIPGSTLSHHLLHLKKSGLIKQSRNSNVLVCSVNFSQLNAAMDYLQAECCIREITQKAG